MIARCPNNKDHKRFGTVAHVVQTWEVDENGNFLSCISTDQTTHGPTVGNTWDCLECGADAEVTE